MEPTATPTRRKPKPIEVESKFDLHEMFFSTTDRKGIITYGNDVFVRVSGYPRETLMGAPHSIIRHPEMPRVVFQLLWDYLLAGKSVAAYVKNMSASGAYYWVCAMATPVEGGFLSIRLKPNGPLLPVVSGLYKTLLAKEQQIEQETGSRKEAIEASKADLLAALKSAGFADYDALMETMLSGEVKSRRDGMGARTEASRPNTDGALGDLNKACSQLGNEVASMVGKLGALMTLDQELTTKAQFMTQLAWAIQRLSLNAQIRATRQGVQGAPLQVIADQMNAIARQLGDHTDDICRHMDEVNGVLRKAASGIATSELSMEMMTLFLRELSAGAGSEDARHRVAQLAQVVNGNFDAAHQAATRAAAQVEQLHQRLDSFIKQVRTLEILHITGRVEAVRCPDGHDVAVIFEDVHAKTQETREKLTQLLELIDHARFDPPNLPEVRKSLKTLLAA